MKLPPNLTKLVSKFLIGTEKLSPKVESNLRRLITSSGRALETSANSRGFLMDTLIGRKGGLDVIKARVQQGGLLGPGGAILGDAALDPKFKQLVRNIASSKGAKEIVNPSTGKAISRTSAYGKALGMGALESLNPIFSLGMPVLDARAAMLRPDYEEDGGYSGILKALGSGAGFAIGGPLGLIGGSITGELGGRLGKSIGEMFDPTNTDLKNINVALKKIPSNYILDEAVPSQYT